MDELAQVTKLLEESVQRRVPVLFCNPFSTTVESASVLKVISLVPLGVKTEEPLALKETLFPTVTGALKVESALKVDVPLTITVSEEALPRLTSPLAVRVLFAVSTPVAVSALLTVVVPDVAPRERVVAALPIERLVTLLLKIVPVPVVEVISALTAPFTATSPVTTAFPPKVVVPVPRNE
jgi:hypothetical protein